MSAIKEKSTLPEVPRRASNAAPKLVVIGISIALILSAGILSLTSSAKQQLQNRAANDQQTLRAIGLVQRAQDVVDSFSSLTATALSPHNTSQKFSTEWLNRSHQLVWTLDDLAILLEKNQTPSGALGQAQQHAIALRAAIQAHSPPINEPAPQNQATQAINNLTLEIKKQLSATRIVLQQQLASSIQQRAAQVTQQLQKWSLAFVAIVLILCIALSWFIWRWWQKPFSATVQALHRLTSKGTGKSIANATVSTDIPYALASELHVLAYLIADGNRLALQAAQQAIGSRVSQQLFELAKTIPGVVFQYEYLQEGTRVCHFVSPKVDDFFPTTKVALRASTEDALAMRFPTNSLPAQDQAVPLGLIRSMFEHIFTDLQAKPDSLAYDTALQLNDATQWIRTLATVTRHSNGSTIVNGVWLDVTENIEQASALAKAHSIAEQIAAEKARLLAVMSHEIRTPLNGILGMAQLAIKGDLSARQTTRVESILSSSHHLMSIINDILDFSKIESGQIALESTSFSLQQSIADVCDLLAPRAAEKCLELWTDIAFDIEDQLLGDPYRIQQILINFIANAIKFTPSGEVGLQVRMIERTEHSLSLQFEVRDTGIGISSDDQKKLFQAFHQADVSTTRKYGGTGLGLAISSHFAQLLGGQAGVQSQLGQGSLFWFSAVLQRTKQPPAEAPSWLQHKKVLLVESHGPSRNAVQALLTQVFACEVIAVNSGHHALLAAQAAHAQDTPFDLGLFASRLIDGQATQFIAALRQQPPAVLALWLSAPPESIQDELALQPLGVSRLLPKPLNLIRLRQAARPDSPLALRNDVQPNHQPPQEAHAIALSEQAEPLPSQHPDLRILVVDDNALNRTIAAELLKSRAEWHVQVDCAEDGHAAVLLVTSENAPQYDAVLMDLQMPKLDGFSATSAIRRASIGHATPIFAMSAHHGEAEQRRATESGVDGFIHKPIVEQQLWSTLEQRRIVHTMKAETHTMPTIPPFTATEVEDNAFNPSAWLELAQSISHPRAQALAERFIQQSSQQLSGIQAALATQDLQSASELLHQLSGTAGTFGLVGLGNMAAALSDSMRKKETPDDITAQLAQLNAYASTGHDALRERISASPHTGA